MNSQTDKENIKQVRVADFKQSNIEILSKAKQPKLLNLFFFPTLEHVLPLKLLTHFLNHQVSQNGSYKLNVTSRHSTASIAVLTCLSLIATLVFPINFFRLCWCFPCGLLRIWCPPRVGSVLATVYTVAMSNTMLPFHLLM